MRGQYWPQCPLRERESERCWKPHSLTKKPFKKNIWYLVRFCQVWEYIFKLHIYAIYYVYLCKLVLIIIDIVRFLMVFFFQVVFFFYILFFFLVKCYLSYSRIYSIIFDNWKRKISHWNKCCFRYSKVGDRENLNNINNKKIVTIKT